MPYQQLRFCSRLLSLLVIGLLGAGATATIAAENGPTQSVRLRFIDSATGHAVKPTTVEATPPEGKPTRRVRRNGVTTEGRTTLDLQTGVHTIRVTAPGYQPMTGEFTVQPDNPYQLVFQLDPIAPPQEIEPATIATLHQVNETVFVGFVVAEESGQPVADAVVKTEPSGRETRTDARGYFRIYVPVQTLEEATNSPAKISFARPGFRTEERRYLELWSEGDWIYRIRLDRGDGIKTVDERTLRRRSEYPVATKEEVAPLVPAEKTTLASETNTAAIPTPNQVDILSQESTVIGMAQTMSTPVPVRIPTNIRVLREDGETIDYISLQTYCQRSLPSEWYASWGEIGPGGSGTNSLLAGAVAIRTYAIGYINNPRNVAYDICGTPTCQAYNHSASYSGTTVAVNFTANYIMIEPGTTRIGFKITEYSAENNSLGFSCGDGFTQPTGGCIADPVCTGQARYGHGRGLCQWGTARWATGRRMQNRQTSDSVTNGYPIQNWVWLLEHYYPNLQLVEGAPLALNDYVQVQGTVSLAVRECPDGSISSGTNCPLITTKTSGANGLIIGGPVRITGDGIGYTWWRVQWFDTNNTIGWVPENWLERIAPPLNTPPVLAPIPNFTITEGVPFSFTNSATASADAEVLLTDFETFANGTSTGTVLFRAPNLSGSTLSFLDPTPNASTVTASFPPGVAGARALFASWSWTGAANAWLRLTTSGTASLPNPVISLTRKLKFDIHTDRNLGVALGARETTTPSDTLIGANGGTTGAIEWVGVTNVVSSQPQVTRAIPSNQWMTVTFDLPNEPARNFVSGNGVLSTASGLGTLEHLAFVPAAGAGIYNVYLDNFIVSTPKLLTYSLSNAPAGATINPTSGVFAWTPTEAQGPGVYNITVRVTDNNLPPASDAKTFQITVTESNQPPVLAGIGARTVHAGSLVTITYTATDADLPAHVLSYALDPGAPPTAAIGSSDGIFTWQTEETHAGTTNSLTVRVTDNGVPPLSDTKPFQIAVLERPAIHKAEISGLDFVLTWSAIPGKKYRVQYKDDLNAPLWIDLVPDVTATQSTADIVDPLGGGQRFYRVQVIAQ
jgi:hypothetical protein